MNNKIVTTLLCLTFLLSIQPTFPVWAEATSSQVINFDSTWRLFQTPLLDILGYKIFVTADLTYQQDIVFLSDVEKTVLNIGDQVECSTSISPKEAYVTFSLTFHFGGNTYTFEYDFEDIQVPGTESVASIPIPVGLLLTSLGLPPLPISLNFDLIIQSELSADIHSSYFSSNYEQYSWASSGTKASTFGLMGADTGIASIFLSGIEVLHEATGRICISVPILGKYTLYEFPVTDVVSYSYQDNHIATYYRLVVSSQYSAATGSGWYYTGTMASFAVTSSIVEEGVNTRYVFQGWSGSGEGSYSGSLSPATVSINCPITETALWETQHSLTIQVSEGGSTNPFPGVYWESEGSSVTASAIPSDGYAFKNWILDGSVISGDSNCSITTDSPHTLFAQFREKPFYERSLWILLIFISLVIISVVVGLVVIRRRKTTP